MARPTNANPERTRRRVLSAAADHFARRGVEATALRDVAKSAGVSLATIHYYFGGKQDLYGACLDAAYAEVSRELAPLAEMLAQFTERVRGAAVEHEELRDVAEQLVREGLRFGRAHRAVLQMVMRTVLDTGELEERWRERAFVPFLEATAAVLAPVLNRPAMEIRMMLQSVIALGMRYCLSTPRELAWLCGLVARGQEVSPVDEERALEEHEDHLVRVAHLMLAEVPA